MAFCANCGSEVQGRFCAKCGTPAAAGPNPAPGPPPGANMPPPGAVPAAVQTVPLADNMACALCYGLGVLTGVLFLVLEPYNQNRLIRFHAFQSIFTSVALLAIWIAVSIVTAILIAIPFLGVAISLVLHLAIGLGSLFLWVMLMYKAYNNERWVLPVIGPLAEKQA